MKRGLRGLIAVSPLLWLLPPLRAAVEGSMGLHMLLQFPALLAAGWAAAAWCPLRRGGPSARFDAQGLTSATLASCVMAFWMVPAALDTALLEPPAALLKYGSWWLTGLLLARGWPRLGTVPAMFFLGNAAWMLITAGLLYREAPTRLCVSYLVDQQVLTGNGLLVLGLALVALLLRRAATSGKLQEDIRSGAAGGETIPPRSHHALIGGPDACRATDRSSGVPREPGAAGRADGHPGAPRRPGLH